MHYRPKRLKYSLNIWNYAYFPNSSYNFVFPVRGSVKVITLPSRYIVGYKAILY